MNRPEQNHSHTATLELILLGTGTCVPDVHRSAPGFIVRSDCQTVLLDGGSGTLRRLAETGVDFRTIDTVCLTHFHPDHTADLVPFLFATRYTPGFVRSKTLTIIGPMGLREFLRELAELFGDYIKNPTFPLQVVEAENNRIEQDQLTILTAQVQHSGKAIACRCQTADGRSITYSGDSGYCPALIELADHTDLLLIECSFPDSMAQENHLTPAEVGKIANASNCRQVVLTHVYPIFAAATAVEQVKRYFSGVVTEGKDLMNFRIS